MFKKNIPNLLSLLRIISAPVFLYFFFFGDLAVALSIFAAAGITDVFDGILARKYGWVTSAGKILDPLADKLVQTCVLIALAYSKIINYAILAIFVIKELLTLIGAILVWRKKSVIAVSNTFGKISTVSFYIAMGVIMLINTLKKAVNINLLFERITVITLCVVTAALAVIAIAEYIIKYRKYVFEDKNGGN